MKALGGRTLFRSREMKIALLSASFRGGGAERVQITLAGEFSRLGHRVHFVAFEDDGPLRGEVPAGVELTVFGVSRVAHGIIPLARFLREKNPDAVIAAMAHVGTAALTSRILARWKGKVIVRADGSRRYHGREGSGQGRPGLDLAQRLLLPRADAVVGVSTAIAAEFREDLGLKNCHVIHNPVATRFADSAPAEHPFFASGRPVVIAAGRLNRQKGFSFLIEAFAELLGRRDSKLIILGEGNQRRHLEALISKLGLEDSVSLPGFVPDPFSYMRRSSVFALSSESEPFGLTLVEALFTGIPVVSTDTEGPRDILDDSRLGFLVPFGDKARFADAIDRAIDMPGEYRQARIDRASEYTPERIAAEYLRLLEA
jgi:glycosyltransferase involved in cell wall biosynthesis